MSLWKNTDANTSAPIYALSQLNVTPTQANMNIAYDNVTTSAFFTGSKVGIFGVDAVEQGSSSNPDGGHAGWVIRTEGTGGRSGRVQYETLAVSNSITTNTTDNATFPD